MSEKKDRSIQVHKGQPPAREAPELRRVAPPVDIYETPDGLVLLADLPGVGGDAVSVDVNKDVLTISARFTGEGVLCGSPAWSEVEPREYYRAFALGEDLDAGKISASVRNGVLELLLPKAEKAKARKIKVEAG
jgi:HSP20 family molecular chaperone IbpA